MQPLPALAYREIRGNPDGSHTEPPESVYNASSFRELKAPFMPAKPKAATTKKKTQKQADATETSLTIEEQTAAFLKAGGKIEKIESGVSGQQSMAANKNIKLGNKTASK